MKEQEVDRRRRAVEKEVNATIKLVMSEIEEFAQAPPGSLDPISFNERRNAVVRKIWNLAKEAIRYGALTVQRE